MQKQKTINWNTIGAGTNLNLPPKDSNSQDGYSIEVFVSDGINFAKSNVFYLPDGTWSGRWVGYNLMNFIPTHWAFFDFLP